MNYVVDAFQKLYLHVKSLSILFSEDILDTLLDMSGDPDIDPEPEDALGKHLVSILVLSS